MLAALRFPLQKVVPIAVAAMAVALVVVLAFQSALRLDLGDAESLDDATSGRYELIRGGIDLAARPPDLGLRLGLVRRTSTSRTASGRAATRSPRRTRSRSPSPPSRA